MSEQQTFFSCDLPSSFQINKESQMCRVLPVPAASISGGQTAAVSIQTDVSPHHNSSTAALPSIVSLHRACHRCQQLELTHSNRRRRCRAVEGVCVCVWVMRSLQTHCPSVRLSFFHCHNQLPLLPSLGPSWETWDVTMALSDVLPQGTR